MSGASNDSAIAQLSYSELLQNFPTDDAWRLFIDITKIRTEQDWQAFEKREPGYLNSLFNGLHFILTDIQRPVDASFILALHAKATATCTIKRLQTSAKGQFRDGLEEVEFGLSPDNISVDGANELIQQFLQGVQAFSLIRDGMNNEELIDEGCFWEYSVINAQTIDATLEENISTLRQRYPNKKIVKTLSSGAAAEHELRVEALRRQCHKQRSALENPRITKQLERLSMRRPLVSPSPRTSQLADGKDAKPAQQQS